MGFGSGEVKNISVILCDVIVFWVEIRILMFQVHISSTFMFYTSASGSINEFLESR